MVVVVVVVVVVCVVCWRVKIVLRQKLTYVDDKGMVAGSFFLLFKNLSKKLFKEIFSFFENKKKRRRRKKKKEKGRKIKRCWVGISLWWG